MVFIVLARANQNTSQLINPTLYSKIDGEFFNKILFVYCGKISIQDLTFPSIYRNIFLSLKYLSFDM
jgi:hypothetical protein